MKHTNDNPPAFFCDAMLGGLARWLRAAGYDAAFRHGIDDGVIVAESMQTGRILLSSDGPMFQRKPIRDGQLQALYIPQQLSRLDQLIFVVDKFALKRLPARCMACGGQLQEIPKHSVLDEAPPLAYRSCDTFYRCARCEKLMWRGTHWNTIDARLNDILKFTGDR